MTATADPATVQRPRRVTVEVPGWLSDLSDRGVQASLVLVGLAAAGFAVLGLGWAGVAARAYVPLEMPYLVSGAVGGLALAGAALGLLAVHVERRRSALDRLELDVAIHRAADVAEALPAVVVSRRPGRLAAPPAPGAGPTLVSNGRTLHRASCRMAAGRSLRPVTEHDGLRPCRICNP